jgi:hypothetical protein
MSVFAEDRKMRIEIRVLPDEEMEVDRYDEDGECPLPTQDEEINAENREDAFEYADYREPEPGAAFRQDKVCGSCGAYNQTEKMMACIGDTSGQTGYCQKWKFVCEAGHTCNSWVKGGPITSKMQESYNEYF